MIDAATEEARQRLTAALGARRWVDDVARGGPYDSVAALVEAGDVAARGLTDAELDEAAGNRTDPDGRPSDDGSQVQRTVTEQGGLGRGAEGVDAAIARGAAVYQERFRRAFLIQAEGRSPQEVLDELQRRLKNDPRDEAAEAKDELRRIAALRLGALFRDAG